MSVPGQTVRPHPVLGPQRNKVRRLALKLARIFDKDDAI
ncbi:hypothetical protein ABIE89_000315 [Bradyrhizobium niftali]